MHRRTSAIRIKADNVGDDGTFSGYGSVFGVVDSVGDVTMPGAFADSLAGYTAAGRRPKGLWQHDPAWPICTWTKMVEDGYGLWCEGRLLLDLDKAREAHTLMKAGEVDGLSIGFRTIEDEMIDAAGYQSKYGKPPVYTTCEPARFKLLHKVDLWEVSLVTFQCLEPARVESVKGRDAGIDRLVAAVAARQLAIGEMMKSGRVSR